MAPRELETARVEPPEGLVYVNHGRNCYGMDEHYIGTDSLAEQLRLARVGAEIPPGGGEPEGRQPPEGHGLVEDVRTRVQREHRRTPAAGSQGIENRG